ncbi:WG repeat-containing protein [Aquimarina sp. BL5]|uniref:WG repeat-containing protein n=1 Tax=Aquimarina sp. BL5 TaxID=1714860 RepID=UPI000E53410C|nr:WG repeat-containing protein [Aquimarina sp. BL5]AXT49496.1 WG repeat-containing protein [Aquimarina sp. BL5]RKN02506.1 WG repeat-containing protein [Aquimarina sp. BL5]
MIKNIVLSISILLIVSCNGQQNQSENCHENTPKIKEDNILLTSIKEITLGEAKTFLEDQYNSIETLIDFSEANIEFSLTSGEAMSDEEPKFSDSFYQVLPKDSIEKRLDTFFNTMYLQQEIQYPDSYLQIPFDRYDLDVKLIKDYWEDDNNMPILKTNTIYYSNKTTVKDTASFQKDSYRSLATQIPSSKPMDSIEAEFSYTYPIIKEVMLEQKETKTELPDGSIVAATISGNTVSLQYPNTLHEKIVAVEGIHESNNYLVSSGSSGSTRPTKEMIAYLKCFNGTIKTTIDKIENNEIDSKELLRNFLLQNVVEAPENDQLRLQTFQFSGAVKMVKVYIQTGVSEKINKSLILKRAQHSQKATNGYYLAIDKETRKQGLVDETGVWAIHPEYENLRMMNYYYYSGLYNNDYNQLYWLNTKTKRLERVSYELDEVKIYSEKLVNIERETNGPEGVINAKTGSMVIPMKYDYIRPQEGFFITDLNNKEGLYDKNGRRILPEIFNSISIKDDMIYVSKEKDNSYDVKDIYSLKGVSIKKGQWNDYGEFFGKDDLLLVKYNYKKNNVHYYDYLGFINKKGTKIINTKKYLQVKPFSNGLAAVKDKESKSWGYIDTTGKVVIPFLYNEANAFQERYAYVVKNKEALLIDKNNKVFKKLPDTYSSASLPLDSNEAKYHLYNGETYDADGNLVKDKESK